MMRLGDGCVHPCVEINFRMTMGLLALLLYNKGSLIIRYIHREA